MSTNKTVRHEQPYKLGPPLMPIARFFTNIECRHEPDDEWERVPYPLEGEMLNCEAGTELRIVGKGPLRAWLWDMIAA